MSLEFFFSLTEFAETKHRGMKCILLPRGQHIRNKEHQKESIWMPKSEYIYMPSPLLYLFHDALICRSDAGRLGLIDLDSLLNLPDNWRRVIYTVWDSM